jgi:hypothetical protein
MNRTPFIERVARYYAWAPVIVEADRSAWTELALETNRTAEALKGALDVRYTPNPEPYATAYDMLTDIARGRIVVSTANSEHPVWSLSDNVNFRLVHDVVGHGTTGAGFDWGGEWTAYERHLSTVVSPRARQALFTEAVGQVAYALVNGGFTEQKVALLPQYLQWGADAHGGAYPKYEVAA